MSATTFVETAHRSALEPAQPQAVGHPGVASPLAGATGPAGLGPRRRITPVLANLTTGRKLLALAAICVAPGLVLSVVGARSLNAVEQENHRIGQLQIASAELFHLDNRNSEIKADAFRSMVESDVATVRSDTEEDIASANEVIDLVLATELPDDLRASIEGMRSVADDFYGFVTDWVSADTRDRDARNPARISEANHTLDSNLEKLRGQVDLAIADAEESVAAEQARAQLQMVIVFVLGLVLASVLALVISRRITLPLRRTVTVLEGVAEGRLDQRLDVDTRDEIGQMAVALNNALTTLGQAMSEIDGNAQALASASEELSSVSSQMAGSASESSSQAGLVSAAAEQVSRNVQTVATGTEEMSASIREIAHNATSAAGVAAQAVVVAESTNVTVAKLGESSTEVGNVIKVINSIAEQTNLLALNATIEAARAGEAGKGFAVVANEVKELAQETSKATEDIGRRIEAIQADTTAAVAAIGEIAGIIGQINDTQSTIASAVEEQTATTNEMSRNVAEAATGSTDIAQNITGVARSASDTQAAAGSTSQAAEELARMAAQMRTLVGQFSY